MILHVEDDVQDDSAYFTSTIFLVCAISPAASRHKYTPHGDPEASNIMSNAYRTVLTQ